jgi:uncharacterized membrane protein
MARREPRRRGLDQPKSDRRVTLRPNYDPETFGRLSERIARFFGTARYLAIQTVVVICWISYNGFQTFLFYHDHGSKPFDIYPFILLNLVFSTQAAYAAPLILLAQTRQAERDRITSEDDRSRNERNIADTEYLAREVASLRIALGDVATRDFIRGELQRMLEDLDDRRQAAEDAAASEPVPDA